MDEDLLCSQIQFSLDFYYYTLVIIYSLSSQSPLRKKYHSTINNFYIPNFLEILFYLFHSYHSHLYLTTWASLPILEHILLLSYQIKMVN